MIFKKGSLTPNMLLGAMKMKEGSYAPHPETSGQEAVDGSRRRIHAADIMMWKSKRAAQTIKLQF